jgi:ABC-type lipoprotein export system ATPase subunit
MNIDLQHISKHYPGADTDQQRIVLDHIDIRIESGASIGIVGPSGSGKSTLLNIIGTLDAPTDGKVLLDGREVGKMKEKELATLRNREIGFVFQLHHLLPQLTLLENVLVPTLPLKDKNHKNEAREHAKKMLETVGLSNRVLQRPGQLSVGECQRAAVVRALINKPKLLLADEPTGSLDRKSAEKLGDLFAAIHEEQKLTMIVVTHSHALAERMQNVYQLRDGKLYSGSNS